MQDSMMANLSTNCLPFSPGRAGRRGMSLVEVLITLAIMTLVTGTAVLGFGAIRRARLRQSAVLIASAVRVAYGHATTIGKPVRLVLDFESRMVILEEASGSVTVDRPDKTRAEIEKEAEEEAKRTLEGPRRAKPTFSPTKAFGFDPGKDKPGKQLADGVRFLSVDSLLISGPVEEGRAELRFWPGGQTERAVIQLVLGNPAEADEERDMMSIVISPLTGKSKLEKGRIELKRPRDDDEESERDDF